MILYLWHIFMIGLVFLMIRIKLSFLKRKKLWFCSYKVVVKDTL